MSLFFLTLDMASDATGEAPNRTRNVPFRLPISFSYTIISLWIPFQSRTRISTETLINTRVKDSYLKVCKVFETRVRVVLADYRDISQDEGQASDLDGIVGNHFLLYGIVGNHFSVFLKNSIPVDRVKTPLVLQGLDPELCFMNL